MLAWQLFGRTDVQPDSCDQLKADGHEDQVRELTGLRLDPYFSATKLSWIKKQEPNVWAGVEPDVPQSGRSIRISSLA